jgi:hypothetical protein
MKTKISLGLALCFLTAYSAKSQSQSFLTNGLVAYYPFNGNANDESGNGNDASISGAVLTADRFGVINKAFHFNGAGDSINASVASMPLGNSPRSIVAWIKPDTGGHPINGVIDYGNGDCTGLMFAISYDKSGNDNLGFWGGCQDYASSLITPSNQWSFVALTYDGSNIRLYANGGSETNAIGSLNAQNSRLWIGAETLNDGGSFRDYFRGSIDDVRIYNRALSASEVQQLYFLEAPCLPHRATARATVTNGFVVGATITDFGCGYTGAPIVLIQGGGGTDATATAVTSNGFVVNIVITDAGIGYTNAPSIYIYSPLGLQIGLIKAVKPSFSDLFVGTNYQLQVSSDLNNWTNQGTVFMATNPAQIYPQYWDVNNWNQLFFRLQVSP